MHEAGGRVPAGYLIEKSLSMDNVFMFALIFSYFAVPAAHQHRALFLGIFGALLMRAAFIAGGAALLQEFRFADHIFGAFLVVTGVRLARNVHRKVDLDHNAALRLLRRTVPFSDGFRGARLLLRGRGPDRGHADAGGRGCDRGHRPLLRPRLHSGRLRRDAQSVPRFHVQRLRPSSGSAPSISSSPA